MATIKKGILGGFSGKVGTVIGGNWKGVDYMRSLPKASSKAASAAQTEQRLKFAAVINFLKPINGLINLGYQAVSGAKTPLNASVSYHLKHAVSGIAPDFSLDLSKVVFSQGDLVGAASPAVAAGTTGSLNFTWQNNSNGGMARADDDLIILVYNSLKNQFIVLEHAAVRSEEEVNLILPETFVGDELACWISFVAKEAKKVATSVYIGNITL